MRKLFFLSLLFLELVNAQGYQIDTLVINGLKKSKPSYIQKLIFNKKDVVFDSISVQNDIIRLIREPAVSHAFYTLDTLKNNHLKVTYHILENKTLIPALDLWSTIDGELAYHLGVTDHNFLGRGYKLGLFYRKNNFDGLGLVFGNPNFINYSFGWQGIIQKRNTSEPVVEGTEKVFYNYKYYNGELGFSYRPSLIKTFRFDVGYLKENYELENGYFSEKLPNFFATEKFLSKISYDHNQLEQYYYFQSGIRNQLTTSWVMGENFSGEQFFFSISNETHFFVKTKSNGNWASRLQLGLSRNIQTPFPAFVLDNNMNLRGVGNKTYRGSMLASFNTEYRQTLIEGKWLAIQLNGFLDTAAIRQAGDHFRSILHSENLHLYSGIGVRLIHKYIHTAILRIDYGYSLLNDTSKGLVFGIGQFF